MLQKYIKSKEKRTKLTQHLPFLRDIVNEFGFNNMKTTSLNGYVYDISVGCKTIDISDIINIYKYLIKSTILNNV